MRIRFRGAASVVLIILVIGCGISAIAQSSSGNKADVPSPPATASNASNGSASTEVTSASAKTVLPAVDPSAGNHSSHPDLKAASSLKGKVNELYTVGVADGLFVSVWKEPDLSGAVVVRPDGMITVPVVGDVHVVGLTTPQVQNLLTEKLKDVVAEPQVTVIVRDIRSRKAYLIGKVGHPGAVALTSPETVLQILAEAGGPAQLAKPQKMYVLRTVGGKQERIEFNYRKVLTGAEPDLDVLVGDVIVVP
jgi:polysaccharide export outer membrane protein